MISQLRTMWRVLMHTFTPAETVQYPEVQKHATRR